VLDEAEEINGITDRVIEEKEGKMTINKIIAIAVLLFGLLTWGLVGGGLFSIVVLLIFIWRTPLAQS
jgi:hypothetical protein